MRENIPAYQWLLKTTQWNKPTKSVADPHGQATQPNLKTMKT